MTYRILHGMIALLCVAIAPSAATDEDPALEPILVAHCSARDSTSTLQAQFVQTRTFTLFDEQESSEGELFYAHPDRICWQYSQPDHSSTVINGELGWSLFPDIKQIQKFAVKNSGANKILSLVGFGSCDKALRTQFQITLLRLDETSAVLQMIPTDAATRAYVASVELTLARSDYLPRRIALQEQSGDLLVFEFRDVQRNPTLDRGTFQYQVPPGYEVVEY